MADLITLLNRFENAAGVYERSDDPADRDELHAARRAIMEAFEARSDRARSCTCHPDDNPPVPCAEKYAFSECIAMPANEREAELVKALKAAMAFIDSNVADPDITDEMAKAYSAMQDAAPHAVIAKAEARAAIDPSLEQE